MASQFRELLSRYRAESRTEREKGTYFEKLTKIYLENAPTQRGLYSRVLTFAEFAKERGEVKIDTGIDLVAQIEGSPDEWCAIQCKFYAEGYRIRREDIDSFLAASARIPFVRRIFVDTTGVNWSQNAEDTFNAQSVETLRIGLTEMEDSGIDWGAFASSGTVRLNDKKRLRPDQEKALECVRDGLATANRGKLIMACGTGKTFTALKIAENLVGSGGRVLFLVPSLALMQQTVREWSIDSEVPLRSFAVCSDAQVGVRKSKDDTTDIDVHDLEIPATTDGSKLAAKASAPAPDRMTVVFSTYQSIEAIHRAQKQFGLPEFDLIVCDEAHRTTGVTLAGEDESNFVRVHDQGYLQGRKRLYMTATPRVYGEVAREVARTHDATLASMDDTAVFGDTLYCITFGEAVEKGLLTDYKVIVLAIDEGAVASGVQNRLSEGGQLKLDDATKIVGCYKALTKADFAADERADPAPMRRAIAFTRSIETSKTVASEFPRVAQEWRGALVEASPENESGLPELEVKVEHIDGTFNAKSRDALLAWLRADTGRTDECRILSNARCLTEGVDVPALDAILFMHPRKSQIDVVQAVGRVMRRSPGKQIGYIILPIAVAAGVEPETALDEDEKYRVVWQILNALRSHDERLDATINKIEFGADPGNRIEVKVVTNQLPQRAEPKSKSIGIGQGGAAGDDEPGDRRLNPLGRGGDQLAMQFDEFTRAILARIVKKCGTRTYWEDWARDVADIAAKHVTRIRAAVEKTGSAERAAFEGFLAEIRDDLNDAISEEEAIEMLAQHLITRPVFEALFEGYSFAANNPVSRALQTVLDVLDNQHIEKEAESLERFYESVRRRAAGIDDAAAKQRIIVELYDKFFRSAFPRMTERLGIVYTPVEIVDFIIKSVDELLQKEFGQTLGSKGVHIIDPFVGTGTFITRMLQSGLIKPEELEHKYRHELHANEIVLLAYYIAAINIEAVYHSMAGGEYVPFEGICLTDTFQLYEQEKDLISDLMADNSTRRTRQKELDIRVIVGNPPYSVGQSSANDNAANVDYPKLDARIRDTYAARSSATNKNSLYDSYIRAFRWASDRIGKAGVIGFVSNAGWVDGNTADGMRKSLSDEFTSIHVFHLRGNQRTSGERSRREGGKVFGQGSRTPVAITFLVKNPDAAEQGVIRFHDIGDYLTREQKLSMTAGFGSIAGVDRAGGWRAITPDEHGDWLGQRDTGFDKFMAMGDKETLLPAVFATYSRGVATGRDAWAFNQSRAAVLDSMKRLVDTYEGERLRFDHAYPPTNRKGRDEVVDRFVDAAPDRISWTRALKNDVVRSKPLAFNPDAAAPSLYRPFSRQWLYFDRRLNEMVYQMPRIFPFGGAGAGNRVIMTCSPGGKVPFGVLMTSTIPSLHAADMGGTQCFPRYLYEAPQEPSEEEPDLLGQAAEHGQLVRTDAITNAALETFRAAYSGESINADDIFHYVYGLLHSEEYRERYADNLTKQLPRIPLVRNASDFRAFAEAGRKLGDLHCDFDQADPYPVNVTQGDLRFISPDEDPVKLYRVEKMKFGGKRPNLDKTTIVYNGRITITGIPLAAYDYVVNGKSAIEWVMERQCVKVDPASGIVSDANAYANETVGDPAYPFDLLRRVITVSLETMKIVRALPKLDILHSESDDVASLGSGASSLRSPGLLESGEALGAAE